MAYTEQDISKLPYAAWLEEAIETVVGVSPKSICIAATAHDGTTLWGDRISSGNMNLACTVRAKLKRTRMSLAFTDGRKVRSTTSSKPQTDNCAEFR